MDEIEELVIKMFDEKREEFIEILKKSFVKELCYLTYDIMMKKASEDGFDGNSLAEEVVKELDRK